jgi:hypothetical protein
VGDPVDVDAARARANAATPGPWVLSEPQGNWIWPHICNTYASKRADAVFIAAARSDVPALADEVDRLRTENEQLQELNGQQARHIEELRKPVQEHCRRWHIPAITERDAALAEVTRLTAIIESAENLCARRCFSAALGGGSDD